MILAESVVSCVKSTHHSSHLSRLRMVSEVAWLSLRKRRVFQSI